MRQRQITLRLSDKEYDRLLHLARADPDCMTRKSGRPSLSSYIRKVLLYSGDHPENLKKEIRDLVFQIKKAGVNINHRLPDGSMRDTEAVPNLRRWKPVRKRSNLF